MQNTNIVPRAVGIETPRCLCEQIMRRRAACPKLRFSSLRNEYLMFCPTCGFRTLPDENKQSVIAEWFGCNKSGDQHIETLWRERYERQQQEPLVNSISCSAGTTVPI